MVQPEVDRRPAAILAVDVDDSSRLMEADERGTRAHQLAAHRKELIDPNLAQHKGRLVKEMGDGLLVVEFASVVDAVECAAAIQRAMGQRNAQVPEDKRMAFRMGVNLGDVMIEGDDIQGDSINIAARLAGLAPPGGICLSQTVVNHTRGKGVLTFEEMGAHKVEDPKGVREAELDRIAAILRDYIRGSKYKLELKTEKDALLFEDLKDSESEMRHWAGRSWDEIESDLELYETHRKEFEYLVRRAIRADPDYVSHPIVRAWLADQRSVGGKRDLRRLRLGLEHGVEPPSPSACCLSVARTGSRWIGSTCHLGQADCPRASWS